MITVMTFQDTQHSAEAAPKSRPKRISPQEELIKKKKAVINTLNDIDLGLEMFDHPEKGRCVKVRKL